MFIYAYTIFGNVKTTIENNFNFSTLILYTSSYINLTNRVRISHLGESQPDNSKRVIRLFMNHYEFKTN